MNRLTVVSLVSVLFLGLPHGQGVASCGSDGVAWMKTGSINVQKAEEIKKLIASELHIGAEESIIEAFFERHGISYSYDRFNVRYQATVRNVSSDPCVDQSVSIYIYVDEDKNFLSSEVINTFTAP